jgi:hypothetical protein
MRLEFRLCRNNCRYMNMLNFMGTYAALFKRLLPYLATLYNAYLKGFITTNGKSNKHFNRIKMKAGTDRVRYTGKRLRKTEPIPDDKKLAKDESERRRMREVILGRFLAEGKSGENGVKA